MRLGLASLCCLGLGPAVVASCKLPDKGHVPLDAGAEVVDVLPSLDARDAGLADAGPDAAPDAAPDADPTVPDTTPPSLVETTPSSGSAVWLHAPIRVVFDEPLADIAGTTVTATLGGAAIAANVTLVPPSTLELRFGDSERGTGALLVHLSPRVADAAGNAMTDPIDLALDAPAWQSAPIDLGYVSGPPQLAIGDGRLVAAWLVGGSGSRRVAVAELDGPTWKPLGATLGTTDVTTEAVALDVDGSPLVAFTEAGTVHTLRWSANAWTELVSPGAATSIALATPAGGAPILALFDSTHLALRQLAGDAWQALGTDLPIPASCDSEPSLAAPAAGTAIVGWIDTAHTLRVVRYVSTWTPYATIDVSPGSRMSLAATGSTVAIAWDAWAGSFGVLAAIARNGATTWTQLGKPLDIDIAGDARSPAIALDAAGTPLVAWTERVETAERGAIARWSGSAWTLVGGVTWLPTATAIPTGTTLAIDGSGAPIVGSSSAGTLLLERFNGPKTPALGLTTRASLSGCSFDPAAPKALLSQTGCFDLTVAKHPVAHAGLVPFDVVAELWSDGAKKRRWIGLPAGQSTTLGSNGSWTPPAGTLLVKEFALETTPGNPATRRPVETRFIVIDATAGVLGFTYQWNVAGTDATLLADNQYIVNWQMDDGSQHAHVYPSRNHCRSCHTSARGPVLGMRPEQLARWYDYDGVIADQMATLAAVGVGPSTTPPAFTAPHDPSASWELRTRGYMQANCSHCHNPQYVNIKDLRYATPLAQTKLCEVIIPGDPDGSVVYQKVTSRPGMPPLGTAAVDPLVRETLFNWIAQMTSCP